MIIENLAISAENKIKEKQVFERILKCIDMKESMVFDAGAGAGKTYALIQSLKYIINQQGEILIKHNQKILCITYTNVAVSEIKGRLGNAGLVDISTIHDCVWGIIEPYQKQLVKIHFDKLQCEISIIEEALENKNWAEKYKVLSEDERKILSEIMNDRKEDYYKHKKDKAVLFKASFPEVSNIYPKIMDNVVNFKKIVENLFKIKKYKETIKKIEAQENKYCKVKYDARFNNDKLEIMKISHDTLLEYFETLVKQSDILKQIICDKYPFILLDEYQDTDPKVINTLNFLDGYSKMIQHDFFVGYFGDVKQNIYNTAVGSDFYDIHKGLERIKKTFNRRSAIEIISIANKIRNDDLVQEPIYQNFPLGSVTFYNMNIEPQEFINAHIKKWNITKKNKLHCFELTNQLVAQQSGFASIYSFFKNSAYYKIGKRFELLRDHVMSLDVKKLGIIQNLLFRILDFKFKINQKGTMISDVISEKVTIDINIVKLRELIEKFGKVSGDTLKDYIENLFLEYHNGDEKYDKCLEYIVGEEFNAYTDIETSILNHLYFLNEQDEYADDYIQRSKDEVINFLEININEFDLWHNFIIDNSESAIIYHTYHGTKGREFDNVIIFMNSKFGLDGEYFSRLLKVLSAKNEVEERNTKIEEARNLLYVAVTRASINLSILYSDDIGDAQTKIENVFGKIKNKI